MSMMECGHCGRAEDARAMHSCPGCGRMICEDCADCAGEAADEELN